MTSFQFLTTAAPAGAAQGGGMFSMVISMVLIFGVMYFILIRPQKKKDKEVAQMRSNMEVGDEIVSIGGIVGIVVSLKEDTVLIETGSDRSKIRFLRNAIQQNNTAAERVAAANAAAKSAKASSKEEKPSKAEKAEKALEEKSADK